MLSMVRYSPKNKFNLFSVTKRLMNGWDIGEYRKATWLRKDRQTIKFDIKIKIKEVIIFAVYVNRYFPTQEVAVAVSD